MLEIILDEWGEFFLKPSQTTCGDVGAVWQLFFWFFCPLDSTIFWNSPAVVLEESLATQTLLLTVALGRYRHTSSSRQIRNILCWLEILNYCPDGGNGNFHCSSSFLKATSLIVKLNYLLLHIRNIFFVFSHCDGWLREFGLCVPHIYNPVEQEVMAGQFHAPSHPGVLKNLKVNGNILQRYFTHKHF